MDPDLVRLILIVLGVALVVAIYLWDRLKHAAPRHRPRRRNVAMPADPSAPDEALVHREEPSLNDVPETVAAMPSEVAEARPAPRAHRADAVSPLDPEPVALDSWATPGRDDAPQFSMDLSFDAHGDSDYLNTDPALLNDVERKIVVVNVVARDGGFSGGALDRACNGAGLVPGEMSIYHHHDPRSGRVLFSMASMVEPGTFPLDDMAGFVTPGVSLFTQLPGARDGVEIYDTMLATGKHLAKLLQGELQDERHNKLTRQMEEHTRESIIAHRHKIRLARSRH